MGRSILRDQRGVAAVMVALAMPVLLMFCVLSIDVANWFVHKRHLQTEADAAALAGAGRFVFPSCSNTLIRNTALQYSGKGDGVSPTYNLPDSVSTPQARLFAEINKPNYHNQSTPNESDLTGQPDPCDAKFVDVKMTETDLPWFWGSGLVPFINAQARVTLLPATQFEGMLPIGVPQPKPKRVFAFLVREDTGAELAGSRKELAFQNVAGNLQRFASTTPVTVDLPASLPQDVGVRVLISGSTSAAPNCGEALVTCYDSSATKQGLSYIRTWDDTAPTAGGIPIAGAVYLTPDSCDDPSFTSQASCTIAVNAKVTWNSTMTATGPQIVAGAAVLVAKYNNHSYPMTYNSGTWSATGIPVPPGTIGRQDVTIDWAQHVGTVATKPCKAGNSNPKECEGNFGVVQRTFWNNPDDQTSQAGPIAETDVLDVTLLPVSDLKRCAACQTKLIYEVAVKGSLEIADPADPPIALRTDDNQTQSLQCDPDESGGTGLFNMLVQGCPYWFKVNQGETCPSTKTALWATPKPWPCVAISSGLKTTTTAKALNARILCNVAVDGPLAGDNCTANGSATLCKHPNKWPNYSPDDPRIVDVFLTPYGSFTGSGTDETVPVIGAASFYITGYTANNNPGGGGGVNTPCAALTGPDADDYAIDPPPKGHIAGHFIVGVEPSPNGGNTGPGNTVCDVDAVGKCVAVLVK